MQPIFRTNNTDTARQVMEFIQEWENDSDEILVQTSGSTGEPRKIRLKKVHMIASAQATLKALEIQPGMKALLSLSAATIGGKMMIVRAIAGELELIVSELSSSPLESVEEPIDFAAMVPMQLKRSLESEKRQLNQVRKLIVGGAPMSQNLIERCQTISTQVYQTFGMTETISHIALKSINQPRENHYNALSDVELSLDSGCLVIEAPKIGVQGLKTNDHVELHSSQSFTWLGRKDFVINSGGVKIHPEQVEERIAAIINLPFFVFGQTDELLGERLALCIESADNQNLDKNHFKSILSPYYVPKVVYYLPQFSYTQSGKIDRLNSLNELGNALEQVL